MVTIFSTAKAFRDNFYHIQWNAIRSWTLLRPRPEIILLGDDSGTREVAETLGIRHVPEVRTNQYGTPLVSSLFESAEAAASNRLLCYVNADIILTSDFMPAVQRLLDRVSTASFLGVGRKVNLLITRQLDFDDPEWEAALTARAKSEARYVTTDSDFFLFPKGTYSGIPPFAVGRCFWSPWFVFDARKRRLPVIDMTPVVTSIEATHDYSHAVSTGRQKSLSGAEYTMNRNLFKGCRYFTTVDATHLLGVCGLQKAPPSRTLKSWRVRAGYYVYFLLKGPMYPYSFPAIALYRVGKNAMKTCNRWRGNSGGDRVMATRIE